jgi:NCAIR mutase (PurE)-related protein
MAKLQHLLENIKAGNITIEEGLKTLENLPFMDLGEAKIDFHRELRKGFPESIFAPGKTISQIRKIVEHMVGKGIIVITKANKEIYESVKNLGKSTFFEKCNLILIGEQKKKKTNGYILVVTAGTSDISIAEEAAVTAEILGNTVKRLYDVGIAGIHRLLSHKQLLAQARIIIAAAGMEGVLPGIIAGLVSTPVIALPTSIGYGTGIKGLSAILTMLNSCAPGMVVVNVDNGYGAGIFAHQINVMSEK